MSRGAIDVPAPRTCELAADDLLDALPDAAAVLDRDGVIRRVNRTWRMFALDNGGTPDATGVGVDYAAVCRRAVAAGCTDATAVLEGLDDVLRGGTVESELEYACPSPAVGRWFVLRITPVAGRSPGALVTHVNTTRRKAAELDLERRASQDPLTGLANRALLQQSLHQALRGRGRTPDVGVLFLDLDGFKPVNDSFGHAAGDEVLQEVARRLRKVVRPQDTVARHGGDEFAVVAPRITAHGLLSLERRVRSVLSEPHHVHGHQLQVGASTGAQLARSGDDAATVLAAADGKMYVAKRDSPGRRR